MGKGEFYWCLLNVSLQGCVVELLSVPARVQWEAKILASARVQHRAFYLQRLNNEYLELRF